MRKIDVAPADRPKHIDPGAAPILQWLKISQLVVDDSYQRELQRGNWTAIRKIAARFKWSRFSPVFVAPVEGGLFAIIDGQHRTHAAAMCGFAEVPCQIVQMDAREQAASFAAVNGLVTRVTPMNIFKAAAAAEEPWALAAITTCAEANCRLMSRNAATAEKRAGEIYCVTLVRKHVEAGTGKAVTLALSGIRRSRFGGPPSAYTNEILKPVFAAVAARPWLVAAGVDLRTFFDNFDVHAPIDRAEDFVKAKRREGVADVARFDIVSIEIGEALDKAFPQRMAMPAPAKRETV